MTYYIGRLGCIVDEYSLTADYEDAKQRIIEMSLLEQNINKVFTMTTDDNVMLLIVMNGEYLATK